MLQVFNVDVVAVFNDTTAIQLAAGNKLHDFSIGLTLGEDTNACYMESLDAVPKFNVDREHYSRVIVKTEWGAFGDDDKVNKWRTDYDKQLDKKSANPGQQL